MPPARTRTREIASTNRATLTRCDDLPKQVTLRMQHHKMVTRDKMAPRQCAASRHYQKRKYWRQLGRFIANGIGGKTALIGAGEICDRPCADSKGRH